MTSRRRLDTPPWGGAGTAHRALLAACLLVSAAAPAARASSETASPGAPDRIQGLVDEISASVEEIRRLKFKTPVKAQSITSAATRESFRAKIEPWAADQARHTQRAYVHLGLIPPRTDLITSFLDLAEKDVLGYYDSKTKMLYVLDHVAESDVRPVIAHELTHALEDQHFDFQAVGRKSSGDDHATAISAVIEGSAMVTMIAYMARQDAHAAEKAGESENRRAERLKGAPSFVQQSIILPYLLGFSFLLKGSPWKIQNGIPAADIDEAYANPPRSTRQILHPEQYWWGNWRKDLPALGLPDVSKTLGAGWSRATEGSIGELGLAVLTGSRLDLSRPDALLPSRWTNDAAIGTQGDAYHHYVNGERSVTALLTRWETMRDAEQFDRALVSRGRYFLRYGVHVLVLAGEVDSSTGPTLAAAAMQGVSYWPR